MRDIQSIYGNTAQIFIDLWDPLLDHEKELILRNIDTRHYHKNDYLYRIGERPMYVMYVLKGRVKIFRNSDDGRPKIIRIFREKIVNNV